MYNPLILAYDRKKGAFSVPLQEAKEKYGKISEHHLLSMKRLSPFDKEEERLKVLNLDIGLAIRMFFSENKNQSLKYFLCDFFEAWHRDFRSDFGIDTSALININSHCEINSSIGGAIELLRNVQNINIRQYVLSNKIIRGDIVNSIGSDYSLLKKAIDRVSKKKTNDAISHKKVLMMYDILKSNNLSDELSCNNRNLDEWAKSFGYFESIFPGELDVSGIKYISGHGIEVDFATRDSYFIKLGQTFGDCTAERRNQQRGEDHVENIYWTVFSWIFDLNYQILRVFYNGKPIVKCHILPLMMISSGVGQGGRFFLFVDAIETTLSEINQVSEFIESNNLPSDWLDNILSRVVSEILLIADKMGIDDVYCEKFSNTYWVRDFLNKKSEIFLDTRNIVKIDELEDVYECAASFLRSQDDNKCVDNIFMELQARNTYLLPDFIIGNYKGFSILRGSPKSGLPLKMVYGI